MYQMKKIRPYTSKLKCRVFFHGSDYAMIAELTNDQWVKTCNNPDVKRVKILKYICIFDQD